MNVPSTFHWVDLANDEQRSEEYTDVENWLQLQIGDSDGKLFLRQSNLILENSFIVF